MNSSLDKNKTDTWGLWAARFSRKNKSLALLWWNICVRINCKYWRITIGKGARFWGQTIFNRAPESHITIGKYCRFRSESWANHIGINRPCILCTLGPDAIIEIGDNSGFSGTSICAMESIQIGSSVICGANVTITDTDWHHRNHKKRAFTKGLTSAIIIGDNVWLGLNTTVLKGVTIGNGAVIGANSTVTHDIPPNVMAAGNPAKIIKKL